MNLKWFYVTLTQFAIYISPSLRAARNTEYKTTDLVYSGGIDTSSQHQLPRTASELQCTLAASSKPILQHPHTFKAR